MEQKFRIPKMSMEEIIKWYSSIKPIVHANGTACYLRELSRKELTRAAYTRLNNPQDYSTPVDFNNLSFLADVKMLHRWGYPAFFKPSVEEVIRQIPKEYLNKAVAFEIIAGGIGINSIYCEEFIAGFHVSVVRLYQPKDDKSKSVSPVNYWPCKNDKCPIGMENKDFQKFFDLIE